MGFYSVANSSDSSLDNGNQEQSDSEVNDNAERSSQKLGPNGKENLANSTEPISLDLASQSKISLQKYAEFFQTGTVPAGIFIGDLRFLSFEGNKFELRAALTIFFW